MRFTGSRFRLELHGICFEHGFMVLEEGQTQLRFLHVDQREFSLFLINPQMHRARLEAVFPNRAIMQEGM